MQCCCQMMSQTNISQTNCHIFWEEPFAGGTARSQREKNLYLFTEKYPFLRFHLIFSELLHMLSDILPQNIRTTLDLASTTRTCRPASQPTASVSTVTSAAQSPDRLEFIYECCRHRLLASAANCKSHLLTQIPV